MMKRVVLLFALTLAACSTAVRDQPPLAGARIGGPFALIDQNGKMRTDRDFAGKFRIMYFGYTFCPDVCPVDVAHLVAGYRAFAARNPVRAARIVPIFVTVDPARDTPDVLKHYTAAFDPALVGLTGTPDQIARVAKSFGVVYQVERSTGAAGYLVGHSRAAYLMDADGKPLALLSQEAKPAVIADELDKWAR